VTLKTGVMSAESFAITGVNYIANYNKIQNIVIVQNISVVMHKSIKKGIRCIECCEKNFSKT